MSEKCENDVETLSLLEILTLLSNVRFLTSFFHLPCRKIQPITLLLLINWAIHISLHKIFLEWTILAIIVQKLLTILSNSFESFLLSMFYNSWSLLANNRIKGALDYKNVCQVTHMAAVEKYAGDTKHLSYFCHLRGKGYLCARNSRNTMDWRPGFYHSGNANYHYICINYYINFQFKVTTYFLIPGKNCILVWTENLYYQ